VEYNNVFTLRDLIKSDKFEYISYKGSLTTPNCNENVRWIISTSPLAITNTELSELRKVKDKKGERILRNNRPLQKQNGDRGITFYV
jgi:carbonic anhydrase